MTANFFNLRHSLLLPLFFAVLFFVTSLVPNKTLANTDVNSVPADPGSADGLCVEPHVFFPTFDALTSPSHGANYNPGDYVAVTAPYWTMNHDDATSCNMSSHRLVERHQRKLISSTDQVATSTLSSPVDWASLGSTYDNYQAPSFSGSIQIPAIFSSGSTRAGVLSLVNIKYMPAGSVGSQVKGVWGFEHINVSGGGGGGQP